MRLKYLVVTILMIFAIVLLFSSVYPPSLWTLGLILFLVVGEIMPWAWLAGLMEKNAAAIWWWMTYFVGLLLGIFGIILSEKTPVKYMMLFSIAVLVLAAINMNTKIKFFNLSPGVEGDNE